MQPDNQILPSFVSFRPRAFFALLLAVFSCLNSTAQIIDDGLGRFPAQAFSPAEMGLTNNTWCGKVVQGTSGRIYVQTNMGVAIYNGTQWKMLPFPDSDFVYDLYSLENGRVLITTQNQVYLFEEETEKLTAFGITEGTEVGGGIFLIRNYNSQTQILNAYSSYRYLEINISKATVSRASSEKPIFQIHKKLGLKKDSKPFQFEHAQTVPNGLESIPKIRQFTPLPTDKNTLLGFTRWGKLAFIDVSNYPQSLSLKNSVQIGNGKYTIHDALRIDDNRIALTTEKHGLLFIDNKGDIIRCINRDNSCLPSDGCNGGLFLDNQNGLWVSTWNGVARFQIDSPITYFDEEYGVNAYVRDVYFDQQQLIFGISAGYISISKNRDGISATKAHYPQRQEIWNILNIDSEIYTLSRSHFTNGTFDENQKLISITGSKEAEFDPKSSLLYLIHPNLSIYHYDEGVFKPFKRNIPLSDSYYKTDLDSSSNLWMTSHNGEIHYLKTETLLNSEDTIPEIVEISGLPKLKSNTLELGKDHVLVASGNQVFALNQNSSKAERLKLQALENLQEGTHPLRLSFINDSLFLLETVFNGEPSHTIIDATQNGATQQSSYEYLYMLDGYRYVISEKDTLGNLWCFGAAGAARADLSNPKWEQSSGTLGIESMMIGERKIKIPSLESDIDLGSFKYSENDLELSAYLTSFLPKYNNSKSNLFHFKITSKQDQTEENHSGYWKLNNLRHGFYSLSITATDALNRETKPLHINFQILPPWYKSIWAILLYVVSAIALSSLITIILLRKQSDRLWKERVEMEKRLKAEAASKEAQLRALRLQINPHFLFNSLNFISNSLRENPPVKESVDRLAAFLRHALEDKNSGMIPLEEEIKSIHQYIAIEHRKSTSPFEVTFDIAPESTSTKLPGLITQPIVENALKYADPDADGVKRIHISSSIEDDKLVLSVFNTGQWKSKLDEQTPIGLRNVAQRIKLEYNDNGFLKWENIPEKNLVVVKLILSSS